MRNTVIMIEDAALQRIRSENGSNDLRDRQDSLRPVLAYHVLRKVVVELLI